MAATRITHRLIYIDPDESKIIPHTDKGSVFPLAVTFTGGGAQRYVVNLIVLEAVDDDEENDDVEVT